MVVRRRCDSRRRRRGAPGRAGIDERRGDASRTALRMIWDRTCTKGVFPLAGEPVSVRHLRAGQHEDLPLLLGEAQLPSGEPGRLELALGHVQLAVHNARRFLRRRTEENELIDGRARSVRRARYLLPGDPIERHLRSHVVVERPVRVVSDDFLARALALSHRLQRAVPVQQLEHGHELLELEHRAALVRFEHEAEGPDARVRVVRLVRVALQRVTR